ncbi:uncharacterized protein LOC117336801 [Pecten maximus]|uniref:uncharacterized protein LOC117336801 n=1 Tax=Pecten maximus TaxID=6579 RepID=UPI001458AEE5|nr:uncharacterized protein LOC117336801 [Pecten maximus]
MFMTFVYIRCLPFHRETSKYLTKMTSPLVYATCLSVLLGLSLAICRTDNDCWDNELNNGQKCVHYNVLQNNWKHCNAGQLCFCETGCKAGDDVWMDLRGPDSICACNNPITNEMICIDI